MPLTDQQAQDLKRALKRCSSETIEAAFRFQENRDPADVTMVVHGILQREMNEENFPALANGDPDTHLIDDLGLDSLALTEVVMSAEDIFGITIENSELKTIRTLGDLEQFVQTKLAFPKP